MKFSKDHLVDIKSLTELEGPIMLGFLRMERTRHLETAEKCSARSELWGSEYKRQCEEVKHIDRGIAEVYKKFGWEEK